ncbi:unnamed protein product [Angiostrongylus costaricensis]|uniref:Gelsolin-like domain-containing protein n=1 Tax=Angiostrongylus costaricensis TaxID=334426 RepID=A0A0R3PL35_ANGCS|nr:unnamed protein product [Angiostrongylus costaricensis]
MHLMGTDILGNPESIPEDAIRQDVSRNKLHPGIFGKVDMRVFHLNKNHFYCSTVNVDRMVVWFGNDRRSSHTY